MWKKIIPESKHWFTQSLAEFQTFFLNQKLIEYLKMDKNIYFIHSSGLYSEKRSSRKSR
jgi:hypothetical protein